MSGKRSAPPWDFFHDASITSLQSFELSRLNHAANLRREIAALLDQWVSDNSEAMLARWVCEHRTMARPIQPDAIANAGVDSPPTALADKTGRRNLPLEQHPQPELEAQSLLTFEPPPPVPVSTPRSNQMPPPFPVLTPRPNQTAKSAPPQSAAAVRQPHPVQAHSRRPR